MKEALLILISVVVVAALIGFIHYVLELFHRAVHHDLYAGARSKRRGRAS